MVYRGALPPWLQAHNGSRRWSPHYRPAPLFSGALLARIRGASCGSRMRHPL